MRTLQSLRAHMRSRPGSPGGCPSSLYQSIRMGLASRYALHGQCAQCTPGGPAAQPGKAEDQSGPVWSLRKHSQRNLFIAILQCGLLDDVAFDWTNVMSSP